jgi:hypothetical protein
MVRERERSREREDQSVTEPESVAAGGPFLAVSQSGLQEGPLLGPPLDCLLMTGTSLFQERVVLTEEKVMRRRDGGGREGGGRARLNVSLDLIFLLIQFADCFSFRSHLLDDRPALSCADEIVQGTVEGTKDRV